MCTPFIKILSVRGTQLKTQDDHIFTSSSKYNENRYYVCIKKNSSGCKARLMLNTNTDSISVYKNEHNHGTDVIETAVRQVCSDINSKSTSSESTKRIIAALLQHAEVMQHNQHNQDNHHQDNHQLLQHAEVVGDYPDEVLHKLPSTDAMGQRIRYKRRKTSEHPPI